MFKRLLFQASKFSRHNNSLRLFYDAHTRNDTIFATSTAIDPKKGSPLGVIRISGARTERVCSDFMDGVKLSRECADINEIAAKNSRVIKPRQATLKRILVPGLQQLIDIGIVLWFPEPNSYTGEDLCEFHLHGSQAIITKMLTILGDMEGIRPAEPGEFTRRAVSNGKMALVQAESLPDLIASKTDKQRLLALSGVSGSTKSRYEQWISELVGILAHLEASIDFGEDELIGELKVVNECTHRLAKLSGDISNFIRTSSHCKDFVQHGARLVILGKPNAGKSTLMNLLCRREKSIVSNLSGTTRDIVEHTFDLGGHFVSLSDTAGLRSLDSLHLEKTGDQTSSRHDEIEFEGIKRALGIANNADIILYLIDGSDLDLARDSVKLVDEISELAETLEATKRRSIHILINKIDLNRTVITDSDIAKLKSLLEKRINHPIDKIGFDSISCKTQSNFNVFVANITKRLDKLAESPGQEGGLQKLEFVNERHLSLLRSASKHLARASKLDIRTVDEMAQHVRESVDYLSRIVGLVSNEQVLDIIFRDFCIGK